MSINVYYNNTSKPIRSSITNNFIKPLDDPQLCKLDNMCSYRNCPFNHPNGQGKFLTKYCDYKRLIPICPLDGWCPLGDECWWTHNIGQVTKKITEKNGEYELISKHNNVDRSKINLHIKKINPLVVVFLDADQTHKYIGIYKTLKQEYGDKIIFIYFRNRFVPEAPDFCIDFPTYGINLKDGSDIQIVIECTILHSMLDASTKFIIVTGDKFWKELKLSLIDMGRPVFNINTGLHYSNYRNMLDRFNYNLIIDLLNE